MFRCKQFVIHQDKCAMKVNTDSLTLGSWVGQQHAVKLAVPTTILDIGTGTGILALMLAQQSGEAAHIDAVELDVNAALQAAENVKLSPWVNKVVVHNTDIHHFDSNIRYELIVSNPPYFAHSQQHTHAYDKQSDARRAARQTSQLTEQALFTEVMLRLTDDGTFFCLYPFDTRDEKLAIAEQLGLHCKAMLHIRHSAGTKPYVTAFCFVRHTSILVQTRVTDELSIRSATNEYTDEFKALCRDFYLKF
ncbi:tRNA1(Val) (adenine(37)-N6)-methyltransferase [Alteromonas sp. KUL49]|nr:methyltransferase domain-containing protein [Alteromonas sp. KUL49]GEA13496.1 tRNA1(Val) (adenine(37)-N6)-methyltransferase [Alteromonas sp. KUL49]